MLVRSKFFPQIVKKIEKLKLSLSKQHKNMPKIRSEMLKIKKNDKIIKIGKITRENFPEISRISGIPRIVGIPEISRDSRVMFWKFPVSREVKNSVKGEPQFHAYPPITPKLSKRYNEFGKELPGAFEPVNSVFSEGTSKLAGFFSTLSA